jgi:hypothetical protein
VQYLNETDEVLVDQSDPWETLYPCPNGCAPILIISTPGVILWEGRGWRIGEWVIRNPIDLHWKPTGAFAEMLIPAREHALD